MGSHHTEPAVARPPVNHRQLWVLVVLFFGFGDLLTTSVGLETAGVTEANPVVAAAIGGNDLLVMGALKALTLAGCFLLWKTIPRPHSLGVPLALALVGVLVTVWNLHILVRAIHEPGLLPLVAMVG
ncbi:MAG: DUF5658 family protein [archaeon]